MDHAAEPPYGAYDVRVDEKGRLKLPADYQRFLGPDAKCFLTTFDKKTVRIYLAKEWERVQSSLHGPEGEAVLLAANDVGGESEIDSSGRVFLVPELRRAVQMENTAVRVSW